ncbi:MAG: ABC transporter permease [Firmicutes bacterium ZCTH02-B6]|nr:MAG: ABC transporter permease [Firmicutes bacterium ZCTH02-B6]
MQSPASVGTQSHTSAALRIIRYTLTRLIALFLTTVVGVYLTILIANMGGHVDEIRRATIREGLAIAIGMSPEYAQLTPAQRRQLVEELAQIEFKRLGLDQPFIVRSFRYLGNALVLNLGRAEQLTSDSGSSLVRNIILERLVPTLLLTATSFFFLFFVSVFAALGLSRRYGSFLDRLSVALAPLSAAPSWFYGIFLILIFAAVLRWLPFGGMVDAPPPPSRWAYFLSVLKHLVLPVGAVVLSSIFIGIYSWRTFFLIYSSEDYVDMARAKGLPARAIERRYILRPSLPYIITSFALSLITLWGGSIILEQVFNWPGLGRLLYQAIQLYDTPIIVGDTIIYAYLLAITVFVLDFVYALVDPRVKVGDSGGRSA